MADYFIDHTLLYVSNGDTSTEDDINIFVDKVNLGFEEVDTAITELQLNQNQALKWAREPVGSLISETVGGVPIEDYSSYAYATESQGWANEDEDVEVTGADGLSAGEYSAKHYSIKSSDSASAAATSATNASNSATEAEGFKDDAEAAAAIAIGQNTISAGDSVRVDTTGVGPFDFEVNVDLTTPSIDDNSTLPATTEFVKNQLSGDSADMIDIDPPIGDLIARVEGVWYTNDRDKPILLNIGYFVDGQLLTSWFSTISFRWNGTTSYIVARHSRSQASGASRYCYNIVVPPGVEYKLDHTTGTPYFQVEFWIEIY